MSKSQKLNDKVALVTGAARRVGAAIAAQLHANGADVAIHYRGSADAANELVAKLNLIRPDSAIAVPADLGQTSSLPALIEAVVGWRNRLDILINNASSFYPTTPGEITEANWDDLVGSNLKAPLFLSQAALPHLREQRGVIINIVERNIKKYLS